MDVNGWICVFLWVDGEGKVNEFVDEFCESL